MQPIVVAINIGQLGRMLFRAIIVLVADRFQPNCLSLLSRSNGDVGKGAFRCCPVPMLHTWSAFDDTSLVNHASVLSPFLIIACSFGDQQNLPTGMDVPIELGTGIVNRLSNSGIEGTVTNI